MEKKTSKLDAFTRGKCPQCRRGQIFTGTMYGFNVQRTLQHCPHCGLRYEVEPGYFYAAMYVSYAMSMAEIITVAFATYFLSGGLLDFDSAWIYIAAIFLTTLVLSPFNYRYSRIILLHWLSPKISYRPEFDQELPRNKQETHS